MVDQAVIPPGVERISFRKFIIFCLACLLVIGLGLYAGGRSLYFGLNQTGMNDYFAFGLWIVVDFILIAFGAGAFLTGFMLLIAGQRQLRPIANLAVLLGVICYSSALLLLFIDIGQPIRGWFGLWHPNVSSMLTEVVFCLTIYMVVLIIEFLPSVAQNPVLHKIRPIKIFGNNLEAAMFIFAGVGAFLSFFHQGSLGGMFGVLQARPFAGRPMFAIWPSTFILFILSAMAAGPAFLNLVLACMEKVVGKELVKLDVKRVLAGLSGKLLAVYITLKLVDTYFWISGQPGSLGDFYSHKPYGLWIIITELSVFGVLPAIILNVKPLKSKKFWIVTGSLLALIGVAINRFSMTIITLALPVLPFEKFYAYSPTWQEWLPVMGVIGYGLLVLALAHRYLPLFNTDASSEN